MNLLVPRLLLLVVTGLCFLAAGFNAMDEWPSLQTQDRLLKAVVAWWLWPGLNLLIGFRTSKRNIFYFSLALNVLYLLIFTSYALNGSTSSRIGAQHMHIVLVPFLLAAVQLVGMRLQWAMRGKVRSTEIVTQTVEVERQ